MKKAILCILFISVFSLNGCHTIPRKPANIENTKIQESHYNSVQTEVNETQAESTDDLWKYEVAERLYDELCYFYDNMEEHKIIDIAKTSHKFVNRNKVGYNCVMAIDRGCGISQVYYKYLSDEKLDDVRRKMLDLDYVDNFSGLHFGYAENGMHFIAIDAENWEYGKVDDTAKNKIRNSDYEMVFLYEFSKNSDVFLVDVFAEDLSGKKETISMNINYVLWNQPYIPDLYGINSVSSGADVTEKYNRNIVNTNEPVKINSWNLYATKKDINDDMIVVTPEGIVKLYSGIPVKNLF